MGMQTLYRLKCDTKDCGQIQGNVFEDRDEARKWAREIGWDLGPREIRPGVRQHTDYCPRCARQRNRKAGE